MDFSKMTLREKVFQTFITYPYHISQVGNMKRFFEEYPCGGVYFSNGSVTDLAKEMEEGAISADDFIERCRAASRFPLIVCADGTTINGGKGQAYSVSVAATRDMDLAYRVGRAVGMQQNYNHVDWVLGPCIDMPTCHVTDTISFAATDDADLNAEMYSAMVRGIQDEGVAATVKHFPGLGTHHVNFHYAPAVNTLSLDEWFDTVGKSYSTCFDEDCMCVMTSHMAFPAWSKKGDDGRYPIATYSTDITVKLLKERLGFKGAVVTDALTMGGMACGNQTEDAVQAFKSGADFLLWPPMEAGDRIVEEIEKGNIPMSRLEDALTRIQYVRDFLGYKGMEREYKEADAKFVDDVWVEALERGIACIRNDIGLLPLSPAKQKKILVIGCAKDEDDMKKIHPVVDALKKRGFEADFQEYLLTCWEDQMNAICDPYELILVCYNVPFTVGVFPKCASTTWASHLLDKSKSMFLNFSAPHFADDYFPEAKTFVTTHAPISVTCIEEAVARLCGEKAFEGQSPVKLETLFD